MDRPRGKLYVSFLFIEGEQAKTQSGFSNHIHDPLRLSASSNNRQQQSSWKVLSILHILSVDFFEVEEDP